MSVKDDLVYNFQRCPDEDMLGTKKLLDKINIRRYRN